MLFFAKLSSKSRFGIILLYFDRPVLGKSTAKKKFIWFCGPNFFLPNKTKIITKNRFFGSLEGFKRCIIKKSISCKFQGISIFMGGTQIKRRNLKNVKIDGDHRIFWCNKTKNFWGFLKPICTTFMEKLFWLNFLTSKLRKNFSVFRVKN